VPSAHAARSTPPTARGHSGSSTTARFFGSIRPPTASSPRSPSPHPPVAVAAGDGRVCVAIGAAK